MNEKNVKIICTVAGVIILCAALIACGAYLAGRESGEEITSESETTEVTTEEATSTPEVEIVIGEDDIPEEAETREESEHKLTLSDLEIGDTSWAYFMVNRTNYIPSDYEKNLSLEGVWSNGRYYYFDSRIADFAECMINDAERDGVTLLICSAYRSHAAQTANFESQLKAYASAKYSYADAYTYTSRYIAIPDTSEHQTGLAVDFVTPGYMYLDDGFENTAAYKWLSENSYKYGFILRYPSSKAAETGINYEPWHFRFIGFEHAEDIYNSGLCLEEYMAGEGDVEFNPMAPLVIPAEPAWYQSYINPPEPETEDATDETESETDTDSSETDTSETDESDTTDTDAEDTDDELPDWLRTESESTDAEDSETDETDSVDESDSDTESEDASTSDEDSDEDSASDGESSEETEDESTVEVDTSEENTDREQTSEEASIEENTEEMTDTDQTVSEGETEEETVTEEETEVETTTEAESEENTDPSSDEAQEEE